MQSFRQKFSEMIREYRDGYRLQGIEEKAKLKKSEVRIQKLEVASNFLS